MRSLYIAVLSFGHSVNGLCWDGISHVFVLTMSFKQSWEVGVDGSCDVPATKAYVLRYPHIGLGPLFICVFLFLTWQGI